MLVGALRFVYDTVLQRTGALLDNQQKTEDVSEQTSSTADIVSSSRSREQQGFVMYNPSFSTLFLPLPDQLVLD